MPMHFLTVRFPLVLLGDDCLETLQDSPPVHEKQGHAFYHTGRQIIAKKLVELFRNGKPDPAAWNPAAPFRDAAESIRRGESANLLPTPIFEIVDGADLDLTQRVAFRREVQQLQEIAPSGFLDPEGWAILGFPNDPRTVLLVRHYEQALQWEPLVRDELDVGGKAGVAGNHTSSDSRDLGLAGHAEPTRKRIWIWALRPLELDHTPNMCCFIDDAPGSVVQMLHNARTGAAIPACAAPDTGIPVSKTRRRRTLAELRDNAPPADGWCVWHRYYRPTEADLSILRAAYPADDPHNPNWWNVKRDLACAKHATEALAKAEAPVLLGFLAEAKADSDGMCTVVPAHEGCNTDVAQEGESMARKAHLKTVELPSIAAAMRQVAANLEAEKPLRKQSESWREQVDRYWQNRCEAARLFLAAVEAGAFGNDHRLCEQLERAREETDRETVGDWQEHVRCYRFSVIGRAIEEWMPERWADCMVGPASGCGEGGEYEEYRLYAARLRILADKIEAVWAISQPSINVGQGKAASVELSGIGAASRLSLAEHDKVDKVFISYSHRDEKFLEELMTHLKPLIRSERISLWSDRQIQPGAKWFKEIESALAAAKVAVMLVTKDFLASDFIHQHELGPLLKRAHQGGVRILWIPVRACAYKETPLKEYQALVPPDKPLAEMKAERDGAWVRICAAIKAAV